MSDAVGPGDLVLCVNAAPNHLTGEAVPLVAGETYTVGAVMQFACPCGRSDALLDTGIDFACRQSRLLLAEVQCCAEGCFCADRRCDVRSGKRV